MLPRLLTVGALIVASFYAGKGATRLRLPSIVGFMIVGLIAGPSALDLIDHRSQESLTFITEIALGFVALTIGLELSFVSLRRQGIGMIAIIIAESLGAFLVVSTALYFLTRNVPLSLIFGAIAPASAPAGTVAVIQEYRARGSLTKALYAVVGFDDGLGIILFGFTAALVRAMLVHQNGGPAENLALVLSRPLLEVALSIITGAALAFLFCLLARKLESNRDIFVLIVGFILAGAGLSELLHLSLILTNMVVGIVIVNTQPHGFVERLGERLTEVMPLLFILFFALAGSNLHIAALPSLGLIGVVYALGRSAGLIAGSRIGAIMGRADEVIKKWLGLGILSQAGVAIGLSLIVKSEFAGIGPVVDSAGETVTTAGDAIGATVLTTITATSIVFELIGPVLTRLALTRAGEINKQRSARAS
jgi:Kef-type K+ transport system membrane component KefB